MSPGLFLIELAFQTLGTLVMVVAEGAVQAVMESWITPLLDALAAAFGFSTQNP